MGIAISFLHRAYIAGYRARIAECIVLLSLTLLQGCTVNAPSCDGRFEPINMPVPVGTGSGEERSATQREDAS